MDLRLDGLTLEQIHEAICDAFPQPDQLERFALHRLGISLTAIAGNGDLSFLVYKLLEYAKAKGKLVQVLRQACRKNRAVPKLIKLEKELLPRFTTEQIEALEKLVNPLPTPVRLLKLAEYCKPRNWVFPSAPEIEGSPMTFSRIIDSLSSAQESSPEPHPLHTFANLLATELQEPAADQIKQWIRDSGGQVSSEPILSPSPACALHLFVKCESGTLNPISPEDTITITAWLWRVGSDGNPLSRIPELVDRTDCKLKELPRVLTSMRDHPKVVARLDEVGKEKITIEVCVRQALLAEDFDEWRIQSDSVPIRLGFMYPVVLRSFERLYEQRRYWVRWRAKWEQLKKLTEPPASLSVEWIGPNDEGEELIERLMPPHVLCIASRLCCTAEHVRVSMVGGAPAMLWVRRGDLPPEAVKTFLEPLLLQGKLSELPERIHAARINAKRGEPARNITLLWDNYDRLPPDAEDDSILSAPPVA